MLARENRLSYDHVEDWLKSISLYQKNETKNLIWKMWSHLKFKNKNDETTRIIERVDIERLIQWMEE